MEGDRHQMAQLYHYSQIISAMAGGEVCWLVWRFDLGPRVQQFREANRDLAIRIGNNVL